MINWTQFFQIYAIGIIPVILFVVLEIKDKIVYRKYKFVCVYPLLKIICVIACLVALFATVTNGLDYFLLKDSELWFVVLMFVCYLGMLFILFGMYKEKIVYGFNDAEIITFFRFIKKRIRKQDITRVYLSVEHLDIYVHDKRIRIGNNFLKGAEEFERYMNGKK